MNHLFELFTGAVGCRIFFAGGKMMVLYVFIIIAFYWLVGYFQTASGSHRFLPSGSGRVEYRPEIREADETAKPAFFKHRKKPQWAVDKITYKNRLNSNQLDALSRLEFQILLCC